MSLVSTPPQSTSSPARSAIGARRAERGLLGAPRELHDAVAEGAVERVVRRARDRAAVVALHEDDRLPERERRVPADVAHRPPRALLVARDELRTRREALRARDGAEVEHAAGRVARLR